MKCTWIKGKEYELYHDTEHGKLLIADKEIFERLTLEIFSTGLSFGVAFSKKKEFKRFFKEYNFDEIEKLIFDRKLFDKYNIIKHEKKVLSILQNAKTTKVIIKKYGSLINYLIYTLDYKDDEKFKNISKKMKKDGFKWCGPSVVESLYTSLGFFNSHETNCSYFVENNGNIAVQTPFGVIDVYYKNFKVYKSIYCYGTTLKGSTTKSSTSTNAYELFLKTKIEMFFNNTIDDFGIVFIITSTPFTNKVLQEVINTHKGDVLTYKELADRIGSKAYRAIGTALSKNECNLLIPCHRIVAKNSIGGFNNDITLKIKLLTFEKKKDIINDIM